MLIYLEQKTELGRSRFQYIGSSNLATDTVYFYFNKEITLILLLFFILIYTLLQRTTLAKITQQKFSTNLMNKNHSH